MKLLSIITLAALFSITACSHKSKACCAKKEAESCSKEHKKACCEKKETKECKDGSCDAKAKK